MLTIFTTTKDFIGEFDIIQKNALKSWRALSEDIEIILIGESIGGQEVAKNIDGKYLTKVKMSHENTPTIGGLFEIAEANGKYDILCYVNADIILPGSLLNVLEVLKMNKKRFLAVGHRWDLDVNESIDFKRSNDTEKFWSYAKNKSIQHAPTGIDYFIFRKNTFKNIPPLTIGRPGWDNWLLWKTRRMRVPLIDLSDGIFAIHQNHSYNFKGFESKNDVLSSNDGLLNRQVIGGNTLNLLDANYYYSNSSIKKNNTKEFKNRNLGKLPVIFPELSFLLTIYKKIYRRLISFKLKRIFSFL